MHIVVMNRSDTLCYRHKKKASSIKNGRAFSGSPYNHAALSIFYVGIAYSFLCLLTLSLVCETSAYGHAKVKLTWPVRSFYRATSF